LYHLPHVPFLNGVHVYLNKAGSSQDYILPSFTQVSRL
jgi:hypothetical protein